MKRCPVCNKSFDAAMSLCPQHGEVLVPESMAPEDRVGEVLSGKYRIRGFIGEGGMGSVFDGEHVQLGRPVAVKMIRAGLICPETAGRFHREAKVASCLNHPNIVQIYDFGQAEDGSLYIVMEMLDGKTLKAEVKEHGPMDIPRAVALFRQICDGVAAAHAKHMMHRDLKPQNIMLVKDDRGHELAKILDFGLAKSLDSDKTALTSTGTVLGSPQYMSPEQISGVNITEASDVYSLGLIFHEMLSGKPAFTGRSATEIFKAHLTDPPPRLSLPPMYEDLGTIVAHCLEKDQTRRFSSAEELLESLPSTTERLSRSSGGGTVVAGAVLAGTMASPTRHSGRPAKEAPESTRLSSQEEEDETPKTLLKTRPSAKRGGGNGVLIAVAAALVLLLGVGVVGGVGGFLYVKKANKARTGGTPDLSGNYDVSPASAVPGTNAGSGSGEAEDPTAQEDAGSYDRPPTVGDQEFDTSTDTGEAEDPTGQDGAGSYDRPPTVGDQDSDTSSESGGEAGSEPFHGTVSDSSASDPTTWGSVGSDGAGQGSDLDSASSTETQQVGSDVSLGWGNTQPGSSDAGVSIHSTQEDTSSTSGQAGPSTTVASHGNTSTPGNPGDTWGAAGSTDTPSDPDTVGTSSTIGSAGPGQSAGGVNQEQTQVTLIQPVGPGLGIVDRPEGHVNKYPDTRTDKPEPILQPTGKRPRVAVLPATYVQGARSKFERELYEKFEIADPSLIEDAQFTLQLLHSLSNASGIDVVEREDLRHVMDEIDLGESNYADLNATVRAGQLVNADYMVIPVIRSILFFREEKAVPYTGRTSLKFEATMGLNVRVVEVGTSKVFWSGKDEITYTAIPKRKEEDRVRQAASFVDDFFGYVAEQEGSNVLDALCPMQIVAVDGTKVTVRTGRGGIGPGDELTVFGSERMVSDAPVVGRIKVLDVSRDGIRAEIIEGGDRIDPLLICRKVTAEANPTPEAAPRGID